MNYRLEIHQDMTTSNIFGCIAYVHTIVGKLQLRTQRYISVGYLKGVKIYKICHLETKKMIII